MRMALIAFKKVALVSVHKNMIRACTLRAYSLWWSYVDSEREGGNPIRCVSPLECALSIMHEKNCVNLTIWCKQRQWNLLLCLPVWYLTLLQGGMCGEVAMLGDDTYVRFMYLALQTKWEIRFWPKAYWNLSPSAKFGLELSAQFLCWESNLLKAWNMAVGTGMFVLRLSLTLIFCAILGESQLLCDSFSQKVKLEYHQTCISYWDTLRMICKTCLRCQWVGVLEVRGVIGHLKK